MPVRDWLLMERDSEEELDSEVGEPAVLLELAEPSPEPEPEDAEAEELVWTETVSVMESVRVDVDRMVDSLLELPVPTGTLEFAGAVGELDELLDAPVLSETPVLSEKAGVGNG